MVNNKQKMETAVEPLWNNQPMHKLAEYLEHHEYSLPYLLRDCVFGISTVAGYVAEFEEAMHSENVPDRLAMAKPGQLNFATPSRDHAYLIVVSHNSPNTDAATYSYKLVTCRSLNTTVARSIFLVPRSK